MLDSAGQDSLDITSAEVLKGLLVELKDKGIEIYVAEVHAPVLEFSQRTGLLEMIGEDHIFPTVDAAVRSIERLFDQRKTILMVKINLIVSSLTEETT